MAAVRLVRGDTWARVWRIEQENGAPVDCTGASARLTVRDRADAAVLTATQADGRITIGPVPGEITLVVPYAATEPLAPGRYRFDLEVTHAGGRRVTYEIGDLDIMEDVSRG